MKWIHDAARRAAPSLFICCAAIFSSCAWSADFAGEGRVSLEGSIVETPCAIDVGDRDQSLSMGTMPLSQLIRDGRGPKKLFSIRLVNCVLTRIDPTQPNWQRFMVTFDGDNDRGHFGLTGEARGVALMIHDVTGVRAIPGAAMPSRLILPEEMQLRYSLNLVGNQQTLHVGNYRSAIRFRIDYY
ncbi:type 1 fimbria pilin [Raoultella sp. BIGb0399]|uniref:fimbrial protein n=1 Tax=Enterobacteriaceae TaxID=543 RepID=UPI000F4C6D2E|nr:MULTISPECIES: fimbrial protein [Enterobacteriaceae]QNK09014.1 type 1 fimbrial protein [Enterobacter sp. JUb54]ROS15742.1 type 1 fimbria pilin [Raoultella sp. BIGb0399]